VLTPQNYGAKWNSTSTVTPTASGSQGSSSVAITGNTGLIPKGTFVKFSGHSKIYMTTTNRSGDGALFVYPNLIANVSSNSMVHQDDVQMTCLYDLDTVSGMIFTDGILMDMGTIKLVEYL